MMNLFELNDKQKEAVFYNEGPLLVLAPAGSGKTKVLAYKIAYLIYNKKVSSKNILALTFTNKASKEMQFRVSSLLNCNKLDINISTFHSFFYNILKKEANLIGYKTNFSIYNENDCIELLNKIIEENDLDINVSIRELYMQISKYKNSLFELKYEDSNLKKIIKLYQEYLLSYNAMDFDDILLNFFNLLIENKTFYNKYSSIFKYILIDEYQDTNIIQYNIIKKLCENGSILTCVGDDDQSIYGFRGANYRNIFALERDFPNLKTIILTINYRNSKNILEASYSVINKNRLRKIKEVTSNREIYEKIVIFKSKNPENEAKFVYDIIYENLYKNGIKYQDIAVLYRNNYQSRPIEELFKIKNVPYKIYGEKSFYEREEIKDILSYIFFLVNPYDELSLLKIINKPKRGIGVKLIKKLTEISKINNISIFDIIKILSNDRLKFSFKEEEVDKLVEFYKQIEYFIVSIKNIENMYRTLKDLINVIKYEDYLKEKYDEKTYNYKIKNINSFIDSLFYLSKNLKDESEITIYDIVNRLKFLSSNDLEKDEEKTDSVNLMTIHSSKGLEFRIVILIGIEEEIIPSSNCLNDEDLEEERRLFYVAMTRAKDKLYISYNEKRFKFNNEYETYPSQFLDDIPEDLILYDLKEHENKVSAEDFARLKDLLRN
ncbi:MAG: exodeoxyribonuclease V subunit gamma [Spirochaetes bacterium]|nr:exodeoxyribonuclease V subunit gamma [Spirochaetota bacterium]